MIDIAIEAALLAGMEILRIYDSADFGIEKKDDDSPLTLADKAAHEVILARLEKTELPIISEEGHKIPFEERKDWPSYWLVDPLDGTKEFIKKNGDFTVNIALIEKGIPVLGVVYVPVTDSLFYAQEGKGAWKREKASTVKNHSDLSLKGTVPNNHLVKIVASRSHINEETAAYIQQIEGQGYTVETTSRGSSLKLCQVAAGEAHLYPRFGPTMEWDTAAAQGICREAGVAVVDVVSKDEMKYNRENLLNNSFIVYPTDWNEVLL
jgi:3'(2'), 5'-bisphosphate nucleotidase